MTITLVTCILDAINYKILKICMYSYKYVVYFIYIATVFLKNIVFRCLSCMVDSTKFLASVGLAQIS